MIEELKSMDFMCAKRFVGSTNENGRKLKAKWSIVLVWLRNQLEIYCFYVHDLTEKYLKFAYEMFFQLVRRN